MSNEKEYYAPGIEEFHEGFVYELFESSLTGAGSWYEYTYMLIEEWDNEHVPTFLKEGRIRVKKLDAEDIRECSWLPSKADLPDEFLGGFTKEPWTLLVFMDSTATITKYGTDVCFYGKLKNKSELQRVMNMVGIGERA